MHKKKGKINSTQICLDIACLASYVINIILVMHLEANIDIDNSANFTKIIPNIQYTERRIIKFCMC